MKSLELSSSVQSLGGYAFGGCKTLTSVTIPGTVRSVDDNAFSGCTSLKTATVSRTTDIGKSAFPTGCEIVYSD